MKNSFLAPMLCLILITTGCFWRKTNVSSTTFADVDRIPHGFTSSSTFNVLYSNNDNPLMAKEIRKKIEHMISQKGYRVQDRNTANYYLVFEANIESSQHTVNSLQYIPGPTQTTQGNIGNVFFNQTTNTWGNFQYVPEEITLYTGSLKIYVYDAEEHRKWFGKEDVLVWSGSAVSVGNNPDLRELIDYLLVSIFKDFGSSTGRIVSRNIWASETEGLKKARLERAAVSKSILAKALSITTD